MIIDILSAVFVFLFSVASMKKGAAGAAIKLAGTLISIVAALIIYPYVTDLVYITPIPEAVSQSVENVLIKDSAGDVTESIDAMPDFIRKSVEPQIQAAAANAAGALSAAVTRTILNIIVFAVLAAATKIVVMLLTGALKISTKLPVIKQFNSLIGMVLGMAASFVILWIASAFLSAAATSNEALAQQVLSSYVVSIMSLITPF